MNNYPEFDSTTFDAGSGKKIRTYFSYIGMGITVMTAVGILFQNLVVMLIKEIAPNIMDQAWFIWALSLIPMYAIGLPLAFVMFKKIPRIAPEKHKMKVGHLIVALIMAIGIMYAGNYIGLYLSGMMVELSGKQFVNVVEQALDSSSLIYTIVAAVIIGPILEELVFRRILIDRTRAYGEKTAVIFSALFFGLFHLNIQQFFYAFGIGVLLGYIYVKTGRIRYTIFLHMAINFLGSVVSQLVANNVNIDEIMRLSEELAQIGPDKLYADASLYSEYISSITKLLPDILIIGLYSFLIMGLSLAGAILLLVKRKKFKYGAAEFQIPGSRVGYTVYFNLGVFTFIMCCLFFIFFVTL